MPGVTVGHAHELRHSLLNPYRKNTRQYSLSTLSPKLDIIKTPINEEQTETVSRNHGGTTRAPQVGTRRSFVARGLSNQGSGPFALKKPQVGLSYEPVIDHRFC